MLTLYVDGHPGISDVLELPRAMRVLRCRRAQTIYSSIVLEGLLLCMLFLQDLSPCGRDGVCQSVKTCAAVVNRVRLVDQNRQCVGGRTQVTENHGQNTKYSMISHCIQNDRFFFLLFFSSRASESIAPYRTLYQVRVSIHVCVDQSEGGIYFAPLPTPGSIKSDITKQRKNTSPLGAETSSLTQKHILSFLLGTPPHACAFLCLDRVLTVFPQLRRLLETMSTVAAMLLKIMVLYSCVSFSFAAIGMAIFGDATSDILEPRCGHC